MNVLDTRLGHELAERLLYKLSKEKKQKVVCCLEKGVDECVEKEFKDGWRVKTLVPGEHGLIIILEK